MQLSPADRPGSFILGISGRGVALRARYFVASGRLGEPSLPEACGAKPSSGYASKGINGRDAGRAVI